MGAIVEPDLEEKYLLALLDDPEGLDLAEFAMVDHKSEDGCFRLFDYQVPWLACTDHQQADCCARAVGKTVGIKIRAFAHPFVRPGKHRLITAPELNHLRPIIDEIESAILTSRMAQELLPRAKGRGIARQPHWQARFTNGSVIMSRLPNRDGRGVKGCCAAGTIVLTRCGLIPIEDVVVGDEVYTHWARWRRVTATYRFTDVAGYRIAGGGHKGLVTSDFHFMWGRRNENPQRKRNLTAPEWVPVDEPELTQRWYLGSPTEFPTDVPSCPPELLCVAGHYVANGYLTQSHADKVLDRVHIVDDGADLDEIVRVCKLAGLQPSSRIRSNGTCEVEFSSRPVADWLAGEFGRRSGEKRLPVWLLGAPREYREAFLEGYLYGDGFWSEAKQRWEMSTASKPLAIGLRLLGQTLGYDAGYDWVDPKTDTICGTKLRTKPQHAHRVRLSKSGRGFVEDGVAWSKVRRVEPVEVAEVYDLSVEDDHSYLADGLISHNMHVSVVEIDEAQDYPDAGWVEIVEVVNRDDPDFHWYLHGVPRGVRDKFFEHTQPGGGFRVHNVLAMSRPSWSDVEREDKIRTYGGSRRSPDYKRNIYGEHGDASSPFVVLARLMSCTDRDEGSLYNAEVYTTLSITGETIGDFGIDYFIDQIPGSHRIGYSQHASEYDAGGRAKPPREVGAPKGYAAYWAGMDVGMTLAPSEIMLFGQKTGSEEHELLLRVHLERVSTEDQIEIVERLFAWYGDKLKAFGIDKMQPVSEPVLTPGGWAPIGSLKVGDEVIGSDGRPTVVTGVYPQTDRRVWKLACSDGTSARCGPEHLWTVQHTTHKRPRTVTTEQLAALVGVPGNRGRQWTLPILSGPAETETDADLPIDPYLLGALLGNGYLQRDSVRFSDAHPEMLAELESRLPMGHTLKHEGAYDYVVVDAARGQRDQAGRYKASTGLLASVRELGLAGKRAWEKAVPSRYLAASPQVRLAVLQGLMDTDGYVTPLTTKTGNLSCHVGIGLTSEQLIEDVVYLVRSLGGCAWYSKQGRGKRARDYYKVTVQMPDGLSCFRMSYKADAVVPRVGELRRYVRSIEPDGEEESVCIRVAASDELYVTRDFLVTHNTGVGFSIWDILSKRACGKRIHGYGFSEKVPVGIREPGPHEDPGDIDNLIVWRNVVEHASDVVRGDYIDTRRMRLPFDREVLGQFGGQTYTISKSAGDPYGRRSYAEGAFHALDGIKMALAAKTLPPIQAMIDELRNRGHQFAPVLDVFVGM